MWKDKTKQKAYNLKYRLENKEKIKSIQDNYYKIHRLERIEKSRDWYSKNHQRALETQRLGMTTPRGRLRSVKSSAKTRHIEYFLSDEDAITIMSSPCYYCGENIPVGIDRVDSNLGYLKENCVACCTMCNYMKRTYSKEDFIKQCKLIALNHK